jgi:hypothetical protein
MPTFAESWHFYFPKNSIQAAEENFVSIHDDISGLGIEFFGE